MGIKMVEGGKDEFEKMNLSGFNSEKLAGRSVRADCGRYASIRFWGITSQDKKKMQQKIILTSAGRCAGK